MKNLDTDIVDNKKLLINVLIDSVYIYDDELTIVFNVTKNKTKTIKKPSIEEINGSFLGNQGAPKNEITLYIVISFRKQRDSYILRLIKVFNTI